MCCMTTNNYDENKLERRRKVALNNRKVNKEASELASALEKERGYQSRWKGGINVCGAGRKPLPHDEHVAKAVCPKKT